MRFEIKALLGKLKITAIYVTHDQNEAMVIADRVAVMNRGGSSRSDRPRMSTTARKPISSRSSSALPMCSTVR